MSMNPRHNFLFFLLLSALYFLVIPYSRAEDRPAEQLKIQKFVIPDYGSGIDYYRTLPNGAHQFFAIADRGPNLDIPPKFMGNSIRKAKGDASATNYSLFLNPDYAPNFILLQLLNNQIQVIQTITLHTSNGGLTSGLPPARVQTQENAAPIDINRRLLSAASQGIDAEGIAVSSSSDIWIAEEYFPSLLKVSATSGKILERLAPGAGLPQILAARQINRGFEGIVVLPDGELIASLQSSLKLGKKIVPNFIRFVQVNPVTKKSQMFCYPITDTAENQRKDVKIGDLALVNSSILLAIENSPDINGRKKTRIMRLDLESAADISNQDWNGKPLEYGGSHIFDIPSPMPSCIKKTEILDLSSIGWKHKKTEGLTLLPDHRTIAITNDNDFGVEFNSTTNNANRALAASISKTQEATELWLITLPSLDHTPN